MMPDGWVIFVGIIGALLTALNIIDKIITLKKKAKEPMVEIDNRIKELDKRIDTLENLMKEHAKYFDNDKKRIDLLEHEAKVVTTIAIKSLQALTQHALDGNNIEQLKSCAKEMNDYLINK